MVNKSIGLMICLSGLIFVASVAAQEGFPPIVQHVVPSNITNQDYRLFVVVPEEYRRGDEGNYDIVYVLDVNSADSAQLLPFQRTISQVPNIPEVIFVGIGFSPDEEHRGLRTAHFTPSPNRVIDGEIINAYSGTPQLENSKNWESGEAKKFADVLENNIKPFVKANYRTNGTETILGASLAGLFLTTVVLDRPDMFTNYIITSPSVWWNDFELFDESDALVRNDIKAKIYLSVGGLENSEMIESYEKLNSALDQNNSAGLMLHSEIIENQEHLSVIAISYMRGLQYIYAP